MPIEPETPKINNNISLDYLNRAWREWLPKEKPLTMLMANLSWLHQADDPEATLVRKNLPHHVWTSLQQLWACIPSARTLQKEGIQKALKRSGLFFEEALAKHVIENPHTDISPHWIQEDWKASLIHSQQCLQSYFPDQKNTLKLHGDDAPQLEKTNVYSTPESQREHFLNEWGEKNQKNNVLKAYVSPQANHEPQHRSWLPQPQAARTPSLIGTSEDLGIQLGILLEEVEGALFRLKTQQLHSLALSNEHQHVWLLELPIKYHDETTVWQLRMEEETPRGNQHASQQHAWMAHLAFDLPWLGPSQVRIGFQKDRGITIHFWITQHEAMYFISAQLPLLKMSLENAGLRIHELRCHEGTPPMNTKIDPNAPPLLNEEI